jgi:Tol biopolymer transport system component
MKRHLRNLVHSQRVQRRNSSEADSSHGRYTMYGSSNTKWLAYVGAAVLLILLAGCSDAPASMEVTSAKSLSSWGPAVSLDPGGANNLNTAALEGCPAEATDGRSLFLASNRDGQIDIWVSHRQNQNAAWGSPEKLPAPVNVDGFNDFCPTPLPDGGLLFVSTRPRGCGAADIYRSRRHPTQGWLEPEHLGCEVNSAGNEFSPSYIAAGGGMLFFSSDRAGQDDIYVSQRLPGGGWGPPVAVDELNAAGANTARPNVSQDGRVIVFDSNREGGFGGPDIWAASRANVNQPWSEPVNLGPNVNTSLAEVRPWLSTDGKRLYFGSNREGGEGNLDLYVSTRP